MPHVSTLTAEFNALLIIFKSNTITESVALTTDNVALTQPASVRQFLH